MIPNHLRSLEWHRDLTIAKLFWLVYLKHFWTSYKTSKNTSLHLATRMFRYNYMTPILKQLHWLHVNTGLNTKSSLTRIKSRLMNLQHTLNSRLKYIKQIEHLDLRTKSDILVCTESTLVCYIIMEIAASCHCSESVEYAQCWG